MVTYNTTYLHTHYLSLKIVQQLPSILCFSYVNLRYLTYWPRNDTARYRVPFLDILCISQGNVATYLRCGGNYYTKFVGNFFLFTAVQEFLKSVKIW